MQQTFTNVQRIKTKIIAIQYPKTLSLLDIPFISSAPALSACPSLCPPPPPLPDNQLLREKDESSAYILISIC